jgi:hypothetical protein
MNKQALIVVLLLFVLFFVPWGSSLDVLMQYVESQMDRA